MSRALIYRHKVYVLAFPYILLLMNLSEIRSSIAVHLTSDLIMHTRLKRESQCEKNSFMCRNRSCISKFALCDGVKDCSDGSDEVLDVCMKNQCPKNTFRCAYGACIDGDKMCNGQQDCADNSDELLKECPGFIWLNDGVTNECAKNQFQCRNGNCVRKDSMCDGKKDCSDGTDETVTHCNNPLFMCPRGSFRCGYGACIDSSGKCDGVQDCADGSDEDAFICNKTSNTIPETPTTSRSTVPTSQVQTSPKPFHHDCNMPEISPGTNYIHIAKNILQVSCDDNYVLRFESNFMACIHGQWTPNQSCLPSCKPLNSITAKYSCMYQGNEVNCQLPVKPGTTSTANCAPGYYDSGHFPLTNNRCLEDGKWEFPEYICYEDCGKIYDPEDVKPQISYGITTKISHFPWNVAIYHFKKGSNFNHVCGGTLISAYIVLTAAHCVTDDFGNVIEKSNMRIAVGKYNRAWIVETNATQKRNISAVFIPSQFGGVFTNFKFDIALVLVNTAIVLSTIVLPVCIPAENQIIHNNQNGLIAGWGLDEKNVGSEVLKSAALPYVNRNDCLNLVPKSKDKVTEDKFCANIQNGTNATNVMEGDSGAGLVFKKPENNRYYIHGIVSTKIDNFIPTFTDINHKYNRQFLVKTRQEIYSNYLRMH